MIPEHDEMDISFINNGVEIVTEPSLTYKIDIDNERVIGRLDGIEALKQAIYKEINTEPDYIIYENYGVRKKDLFGKQKEFAYVKLCKRIEDALLNDDRINRVYDFFYHKDKSLRDELCMSFSVDSIYGDFKMQEVLSIGI